MTHQRQENLDLIEAVRVEAKLHELRSLGKDTVRLRKTLAKEGCYGKRITPRLSEELGVSQSAVERARDFVRKYNEDEFDELLSLKNSRGICLGVSHLHYLLRIEDREKRRQIQKEAVENDWTTRRLQQEIMERFGKTSYGGRAPMVAESHLITQQLYRLCQHWVRWEKRLMSEKENLDALLPSDLKQLDRVTRSIQKLMKRVAPE